MIINNTSNGRQTKVNEFVATGTAPTMTVDLGKTYMIISLYGEEPYASPLAHGVYLLSNGVITEQHVGYSSPGLDGSDLYTPKISGNVLTLGRGYAENPMNRGVNCYSYMFEVD